MHPKVFVSHASEDKERFVTSFATKLRENGVDAWLDKWEMLPGDSLVDKIFEEGLKESDAIIVVLSKFSVDKPWVKEELNASIVSKVSKGTKIIPIVLDDCNVPESLHSTLWETVSNLDDYDSSLKRVLSAIFDIKHKPSLGSFPAYVASKYLKIDGLSTGDSLVLKESCEYVIENNDYSITPELLFGNGEAFGLSHSTIKDSLEILDQQGYIDVTQFLGGDSFTCYYSITTFGFDSYMRSHLANYDEIVSSIIGLIVNEGLVDNASIQAKSGQKIIIVNHVLNLLETNSHLMLTRTLCGTYYIDSVSASLRRMLV